MNKKSIYTAIFAILSSRYSPIMLIALCIVSFGAGQLFRDMNLFASSGAIVTIFGLISMMKFTTIEKYLNQESIVEAGTGVSGPPLSQDEYESYVKQSQEAARVRIEKELKSELKGLALTIFGTLIWAYGAYLPFVLQYHGA